MYWRRVRGVCLCVFCGIIVRETARPAPGPSTLQRDRPYESYTARTVKMDVICAYERRVIGNTLPTIHESPKKYVTVFFYGQVISRS